MLKACLAAAGMHKLQSNIQQSVATAVDAWPCDRLLLCSHISSYVLCKCSVISVIIIIVFYMCLAIISGSGMCDASQLPPDRLVLSITSVAVHLELL